MLVGSQITAAPAVADRICAPYIATRYGQK
jgi:hypothetical protein